MPLPTILLQRDNSAAPSMLPALSTQCGDDSQRRAVAVCFCGAARTFVHPVAHESIATAIRSFGAPAFNFFYLQQAETGSMKGHAAIQDNVTLLAAALFKFRPKAVHYGPLPRHRPIPPNRSCVDPTRRGLSHKRMQDAVRWWETWERVRLCYELVVAFEASQPSVGFGWVVRLRPDVFFFSSHPMPRACELPAGAGQVTVPLGVVMCHAPCMNDHMAWVPRHTADVYFLRSLDLERCSSSEMARSSRDYFTGNHLLNLILPLTVTANRHPQSLMGLLCSVHAPRRGEGGDPRRAGVTTLCDRQIHSRARAQLRPTFHRLSHDSSCSRPVSSSAARRNECQTSARHGASVTDRGARLLAVGLAAAEPTAGAIET